MTITRIARMKELGIFRDFKWPNDLPEFGRYNLIFGWNWSGKTTLSSMLRLLETKTNLADSQVSITIDGRDVDGEHFAESTLPIRVFNRDFVHENVFTADGEIAPIFILGKENILNRKQVDELRAKVNQARADSKRLGDAKQGDEKALDSYCVTQATLIRNTLRSGGSNPYNNYDKRNFVQKAEKIAQEDDLECYKVDEDTKQRLLQRHRASARDQLAKLTYVFPLLGSLHSQVSDSLGQTVISSVIKSFKGDPELANWIRDGLVKHKERAVDACLFCGQPLPAQRVVELEAHFSDEYERFLNAIDARSQEIGRFIDSGGKWAAPNRAELYDELSDEYENALTAFRQEVERVNQVLHQLQNTLAEKKTAPFEVHSLDVELPEVDEQTVEKLNEVIERHNKTSDGFGERVALARQKLENALVADSLPEFQRLSEGVQRATVALDSKKEDIAVLESDIAKLEREIIEHRAPAEELNRDLHAYLGHDELQLEIQETGYRITRHGQVAHGLSEGERTAVALLYFLKSLNDRRFVLPDGIVVLDDPVSSLDSNAIYSAFGFIKERTKPAAQLFILTHNFTFFRQVRNWFHNLRGQKKRSARFYMLSPTISEQGRCSVVCQLDPLLEKYESEYHYLFSCVYQKAMAPQAVDLREYYFMPNVARRLLEAFLAFRMPEWSGKLWQQFQRVEFDEPKKAKIYRFLHTYSHHEQIGEQTEDLSILSEARAILNDVLKLMQAEDPKHLSAMVSLLRAQADADDKDS